MRNSNQSAVGSRQPAVVGVAVELPPQPSGRDRRISPSPLLPLSASVRRAFTLVELLVTISIIAIMTALTFGALHAARQTAAQAATKATIVKLNSIIMQRYESYLTRRVPLGQLRYASGQPLSPADAAIDRLYAIRDIMRMEMPDRSQDIPTDFGASDADKFSPPIALPRSGQRVPIPALGRLYHNRFTSNMPTGGSNGAAELLYMIVSMGSPEAMEQFNQSEIGDTDHNGYPEFLDGWGRPIFFLRWAPGFTPYSDIQLKDPSDPQVHHHDPFDPQMRDASAYQLFPLIYSGGPNDDPGLEIQQAYWFGGTASGATFTNPAFPLIGRPANSATSYGGITNHHIEMR
jgi:prepilin-type N-terminal cleavage/methylation domain-containing protein